MLRRAWSTLEIKSVDAEQRVITGIATSASTDRMGDIVEPEGAEFELPIPLLWQHDSKSPIGKVTQARQTKAGIEITAQIAKTDTPGLLKDRLDLAWQSITMGLVRGLSIGFKSLEESYDKVTGGFHFLKWLWLELSAVTIPANADASIQTIRSLDVGVAAPGRPAVGHAPGASGLPRVVKMRSESTMKSYTDQIKGWEASRKAKTDKMDAILAVSAEKGETLDAAQTEEHDTLAAEVKSIDATIERLEAAEKRDKAAAVAVDGGTSNDGSKSRGGSPIIRVEQNLPKGIRFARFCALVAASKGNPTTAFEMCRARYPDDSAMHAILKAAVAAGTTSASNWADDLVPYQVLASDFIEYLRPMTIIDRIQGVDRVPFNVRVGGFSAGTTGYWKGEGKPIPVSKATSTNVTLTWATVGGLVILTDELVRFSTPSAEQKIRQDIARAVTARMDIDFVDPSKAAVANTSPASITYGLAANAPTGTTAAKFRADLATMLTAFAAANLSGGVLLIMSKSMATQLALMINTLGNADFPGMTPDGGTIAGIPVLVSEHLTAVGSPSTQLIIACVPGEIMLADDGQVNVDASSEASIEMLDSSLVQDGTAGTGTSLVNLWQNGLLGLRAERVINWKLRRAPAVEYISPAAYVVQ